MRKSFLTNLKYSLNIKAGLIYLISNIFIKGIVLITIPLFTNILSTSEYGLFTRYMTIEGILAIVISLGIDGAIRNAKIDFKEQMNEFFAKSMGLIFTVFLVSTLFLNFLYLFNTNILGFGQGLINFLMINSFATAIFTIYSVKISLDYKYNTYVVASVTQSIMSIGVSLLFILTVFKNDRGIGRIVGYAVPLIAISLFILVKTLFNSKRLYSRKVWTYSLAIGIPFLVHKLSHILLSQFDRIMISEMVGLTETGIYGVAYTMGSAFQILWVAFDTVWTPWIYSKLEYKKSSEIKNSMKKYVTFISLIFLFGTSIMNEIFLFMTNDSYDDGKYLVLPISLSVFYIFLYSFYVQIENFYKKTKFSAIGTLSAAVMNILLNYIFIKLYGYMAAAYTTVITYFLLFLFHRIICINILKYRFVNEKAILISFIIVTIFIIAYIFLVNTIFIRLVLGIVFGVLLVAFCIKYLKNLEVTNDEQISEI